MNTTIDTYPHFPTPFPYICTVTCHRMDFPDGYLWTCYQETAFINTPKTQQLETWKWVLLYESSALKMVDATQNCRRHYLTVFHQRKPGFLKPEFCHEKWTIFATSLGGSLLRLWIWSVEFGLRKCGIRCDKVQTCSNHMMLSQV